MSSHTKMRRTMNEATITALGDQFRLGTEATRQAVDELAGELGWAVECNTLNRGGIAEMVRLLGNGNHQNLVEAAPEKQPVSPEIVHHGNQLLEVLLGSKHQSRGVANSVARRTDVNADTLKKLLPVVASFLMGGLQKASRRDLNDIAQRALPDVNIGPGSNFDMKTQRPLQVPGDQVPGDYVDTGNPGGGTISSPRSPFDDLSDIIRRGRVRRRQGQPDTGGINGRQAGGKVRDIFGDFLGFGGSGIIGWLIRLIVVRYGWRILQFAFRRLFLRA